MNDINFENEKIIIKNVSCFSLNQTLDCGQAFRWKEKENGHWYGFAYDKYAEIYIENGNIVIEHSKEKDIPFWADYFDLKRDYEKIIESFKENEKLFSAATFGSGIRILNQNSWEALCSFIISQNNNIPRIKGIIERLCENFGTRQQKGFTFPTAQVLAKVSVDDLAVIRSGFRAKYIIDAAQKVASGEIDLEKLKDMDYESATKVLLTIKGVGPKVSDCAMLYGLSHTEAFPKDVWIKRALNEYFNGEMPKCAQNHAGIAQQYIFYYIRENNN